MFLLKKKYQIANIYNSIFKENFKKKLNFDWAKYPTRYDIIKKIIEKKKYSSYLEIGCFEDETFNKINIDKKVGVDPNSGGNVRLTSDNFFKINNDFIFADLPGYGFAKVPQSVQKRWKKMIEDYLLRRKTLLAVIFIIDLRRNPSPLDLDLQQWLETCGVEYLLVGTKVDKLSQSEAKKQVNKLNVAYFNNGEDKLLAYSSKSSRGRKELWSKITTRIEANRKKDALLGH